MRITGIVAKVGVFFGVSLLLLALLYNTMANKVDGDTVTYRAVFTNVSGLRTGDDVRVAGVKVGRIESIEVAGRQAEVSFTVSEAQPLLSTSGLVMRYQNLLGQRYLSVLQGGKRGERLPDGATIPVSRTSPGFDLTALLNGFRPLFRVLDPAEVNRLSESVVKVLQGEGGTVDALLRQTTQLTNFLADRDRLFDQVATNLTPVLRNLAGQGDELRTTVRELGRLMDGLAKDRATIGRTIDSTGQLLGTTSQLLTESRQPLAQDIRDLRRVARMLAEQQKTLGDALEGLGGVFGTLGRLTSYRGALNIYFCTLTVEVAGLQVDTGDVLTQNSEVCR